jgi:hypothetical protein
VAVLSPLQLLGAEGHGGPFVGREQKQRIAHALHIHQLGAEPLQEMGRIPHGVVGGTEELPAEIHAPYLPVLSFLQEASPIGAGIGAVQRLHGKAVIMHQSF